MLAEKKLHWTQRVALIRHNLHAASRTGDFTFFKTLQAHRLLEGTDHLAALSAVIGDASDQVLASLDNYNSVMAYVHEDAFKNVYESVKTGVREQSGTYDDRRAIYYVDAAQQKEKAEKAIDKMINSAITMINAQPVNCQEEAANVWIWGTTFVADAMEVCLAQIDAIEVCLDDFIRLENSWSVVQSAVGASIGAIKGIFNLMAPCEAPEAQQHRSEATEVELMPTIPPTPAAAMLNTNPFENSFSSNDQNFSVGEDVGPPPTAPTTHFQPTLGANNPGATQQQSPNNATVSHNFPRAAASTTSNNNNVDVTGSPTSTTTSASGSVAGKTRPRSQNLDHQRPVFDDMLFM
ncbi:hypothetical protein GTA08_BOTSDO09088 [Neofusicoccum parvum]|uniref:Uncharacterized protein n=1 Tax=Botryosphaeria parva (strain UCR-NP2) TaxID=1287680 RepID=R1E9D0_BOTPV|nr:hypothetical protein UCRNP2_9304 [Neofusicoccum parvum UCRNP2]GME65556.1 hypothetical protein GTA08_BOTSDO09088 [Neofusicoccum parvum]